MTIQSLNQQHKDQVHAKVASLNMSAFPAKIRGNIPRNYGSHAVFVLQDIPDEQLIVWELLSEVPHKQIDCRRHKSFCVQHGLKTPHVK